MALLTFASQGSMAKADLVLFSGRDGGVGPGGPRPLSNAAAASFDAAAGALGSINLINFETAPLGNFNALSIAPGVLATLAGTSTDPVDSNPGITNVAGDATLGYNTTIGGSRFLRVVPIFDIGTASLNFSFAVPVQAFGLYLTGLGTASGNLFVTFNDGTNQSLSVVGGTGGGVQFFGFTDSGRQTSNIRLELRGVIGTRDIFSVDDVRYVAVPEPASCILLGVGLLGLLGTAWRREAARREVHGNN